MLTLKPEIKVFVRPVGENKGNVVLACFVVAKYRDGHCEIVKTAYKEISKEEYESNKQFSSQSFSETGKVLAICGNVSNKTFDFVKSTFVNWKISPYTDLSFFVSQPTRAPSR